jgi:Na+/melibiose symporter-like transporter
VNGTSWLNAAFLFVVITLFYLFMTMYCTPYNALIPELGTDQGTRMAISTAISFTFIAGTAVAYVAPVIWGVFEGFLPRVTSIRLTFTILSLIGLVCMFVPVFTIREKDYVVAAPSESTALKSLGATFRNRDFRVFVASDISYFLGITMFQTALPFFVTSLLKLDEGMSTVYFVLMTALSMLFYMPVNRLTPKFGKKKLILFAFVVFTVSFVYTAFFGSGLPIPPAVQGYILCAVAAPAMAIFGILPQAVVADIAECDALETGENRSGMFYAARTFAFKLGQSIAMLLVTAFATIGQETGAGYRITALAAAAVCVLGGALFMVYNEKRVYARIMRNEK